MVYTTPGNPVSCAGNQFGIVFSCETGYTNGNNTVVNNFVIGEIPTTSVIGIVIRVLMML